MKPCQQCKFSPLCLPNGFVNGLNSIVRRRSQEMFNGMVEVGIADPRDNVVWNGVKKEEVVKLLKEIPDGCIEKQKRVGQGKYYGVASNAWLRDERDLQEL